MTTTSIPTAPAPDFQAIKQVQQATWSSGNFAAVANRIPHLVTAEADIPPLQHGWPLFGGEVGAARHR